MFEGAIELGMRQRIGSATLLCFILIIGRGVYSRSHYVGGGALSETVLVLCISRLIASIMYSSITLLEWLKQQSQGFRTALNALPGV